MSINATLDFMAPGVAACADLDGTYNPRHGLAIYCLPSPDFSPSSPGVVLGEALAARSGLGCTLLEGVPAKVPEGAVVVGMYSALRSVRPDLVEGIPEPVDSSEYSIKLSRCAVIVSPSGEGLSSAMQTLSMLILRHGDEAMSGSVITDRPAFRTRGLAVELATGELNGNLLMQIVSFAATFKVNCIHLILDNEFSPSREIPGVETFVAACRSFGIRIGVRLPLLGEIARGRRTPNQAWVAVRAAARAFAASEAALDDRCPEDAPEAVCVRIVDSLAKGDTGLKRFYIDAAVFAKAGLRAARAAELRAVGVAGWRRWDGEDVVAADSVAALDGLSLAMDVPAPLPGFSSLLNSVYHGRLDAAVAASQGRDRRELFVSFRNVGVSHMWQNMMYPAATGFIVGWGQPALADEAAWRYSNLLYGDAARAVMEMWDIVSSAFPQGLDAAGERLVRRTAFGAWPETEEEFGLLVSIDWLEVTRCIRVAAEALKNAAGGLSRNALTLSGARLALYALSWLHCFAALEPELERRRLEGYDDDGRTEPIAAELYNNFVAWQAHLQEVQGESGMEFSEMHLVEAMGMRLKGLCDGVFE